MIVVGDTFILIAMMRLDKSHVDKVVMMMATCQW